MEVWRTLRAGAWEHPAEPCEVLGRSAVELAPLNLNSPVSVSYSILDLAALRMTVSNAGQPPLLRAHPEVHPVCTSPFVTRYPPQGPPLRTSGASSVKQFTSIDITLASGDTLLWPSRGSTVVHDTNGDEFGLERITSLFLARRKPEPEHLLQALMEALAEFRCGDPTDDVTLIAIRIR